MEKIDQTSNAEPGAVVPSTGYIRPHQRKPHDPEVTFEEYYYWAGKTREQELTYEKPKLNWRELMSRKKETNHAVDNNQALRNSKDGDVNRNNHLEVTEEEWTNASRLFRTASTGACA